jgi:hypothetical protein
MNFKEIIEGWGNYIFPDPEVEKIAKERALICSECPNNKLGICSECGCPLISKTRSINSKCPINKWNN